MLCPSCQEIQDDQSISLYRPNTCAHCGTRFFLAVKHTPRYHTRMIPPPTRVSVSFEVGQIWRKMGPLHAMRLDQYEPAHGQVGEGWYVTIGDINPKTQRLVHGEQVYSPGPNPVVGELRKLASLFSEPWAYSIAEDDWYGLEIDVTPASCSV